MKLSEVQGDAPAPAEPPKRLKLSEVGEDAPPAPAAPSGFFTGFLNGIMHGAGNVLHGGARIGARMGEATDTGFGPEFPAGTTQRVDKTAATRETAYQADPTRKAHPIASGIGEIGGEALATAPMMAPLAGVGAIPSLGGRLGASAAIGAGASLATPKGGESMSPGSQVERGVVGAAGGATGQLLGEVGGGLVKAIAGNAPAEVDRLVTRGYRQAVKPSIAGQQSLPRMDSADRRILGTFDEMINNRKSLRLTDAAGNDLPAGTVPQTLHQFSEGIQQQKTRIWDEIAAKSAAAGDKGAVVDLKPMSEKLLEVASEIELANPAAADAILVDAQRYASRGLITPKDAEGLLKTFNRETTAFWGGRGGTPLRTHALVEASNTLRETLDDAISKFDGPGYQALRTRYGNLKETESAVAKAALRNEKNIPGGLVGELLNAGTITDLVHGMVDPTKLPRAGAMMAAKAWLKRRRDPNYAIKRLFDLRQQSTAGPFASFMESALPSAGVVGAAPFGLGAGAALPPPKSAPPPLDFPSMPTAR